ncbi:MAG TPA: endonuclease/exonuclease/phosphatase family protein [Candidatus Limnocylindria bacterium]|nr:endonuclease/exonuclease/phosphatase family protein [Candidatus Limnocylindria bacterium]
MPSGAAGAAGPTLRVATYNVRAGIGPGPFPPAWWRHVSAERLARVADVVRALDAEVVALQEVAYLTVDGEPLDVAAELGTRAGMRWRYGAVGHFPIIDPDRGTAVGAALWGNALLSRVPIGESATVALPAAGDDDLVEPAGSEHRLAGIRYRDAPPWTREPRCMVTVRVEVPGIGPLTVASVHLTHVGAAQRSLQVAALGAALEALAEPVVLAGDLNAPIESAELEFLRRAFADAFEAESIPPGDPRRASCGEGRIDHLLLRGLRALDCRVVHEAGDASDHLPVVATLSA